MNYDELEERMVDVGNGIQLYCKHSPKGEPLVFLHGFPETGRGWRKQIAAFSEEYQVIVPNLRGYFKSSQPGGIKSYQLPNLISDIEKLLDVYGHKKATIVAHDWGGGVAWTFTAMFPERVKQLIILNMPHPDELRKQLRGNFKQFRRSYYAFLFQIPWLPEFVFHHFSNWFFKTVFKKRSLKPEVFSDEDLKKNEETFPDRKTWTSTINYYRAFFRYPAPTLPKILPPVGLIWGEKDFALGKELTFNTSAYCEQFLGVKYIPDASHWLQHEFAEEVNQYIREYLKMV